MFIFLNLNSEQTKTRNVLYFSFSSSRDSSPISEASNANFSKCQKFEDEYTRRLLEQAFTCIFYATNVKDIRTVALNLLDAITIHFTLVSLAHYHLLDESGQSKAATTTTISSNQSNIFSCFLDQSKDQGNDKTTGYLDFTIYVDAIFNLLCNEDNEYWPLAQRCILLMIEINELVTNVDYQASTNANLLNLRLFDYLAEKVSHLCFERSWYSKKAG